MRTTIDLPDELFKQAKAVASLRGISLKDFVTDAVEHALEAGDIKLRPRRITLPIVPSKRPGSVTATTDRIAAILEAEDLSASS